MAQVTTTPDKVIQLYPKTPNCLVTIPVSHKLYKMSTNTDDFLEFSVRYEADLDTDFD